MFEVLQEAANASATRIWRGRYVNTRFLIEERSGDATSSWIATIAEGRVVRVEKGPFVMPSWVFALRADSADWAEFLQPVPRPGYHDLFALLKHRRLKIEGDLHVFMANLRYFKEIFSALREARQ